MHRAPRLTRIISCVNMADVSIDETEIDDGFGQWPDFLPRVVVVFLDQDSFFVRESDIGAHGYLLG